MKSLSGSLWGGRLEADIAAARKDGVWSYTLKGAVRGALLDGLAAALRLPGVALGAGDVEFDLSATGPGFFEAPEAAAGTVKITASAPGIDGFNTAAAVAAISAPGGTLQQRVGAALKEKGAAAYAPAVITVTLSGGSAVVKELALSGEGHALSAGALLDIAPGAYEVTAEIKPEGGLPPIRVRRSDSLGRAGDYAVDVGALEKALAPAPAAPPE